MDAQMIGIILALLGIGANITVSEALKSPAAKAMGTFMAPNLSSPPIPVPPKSTIP